MSIITLVTDFGYKDYYLGILKAKLAFQIPNVSIFDLSHEVEKYNFIEAGFILENSYQNFPDNSIHISLVDSIEKSDAKHCIVHYNNHFFIGSDNGQFGFIVKELSLLKGIYTINPEAYKTVISDTDKFIQIANKIINNDIENIFIKKNNFFNLNLNPQISEDNKYIKGIVIYVDSYGSCISNISKKLITATGGGRNFIINPNSKVKIQFKNNYNDFTKNDTISLKNLEGSVIALFNENNLLEVTLYKSIPTKTGSAKSLLGLNFRDEIVIEFI